MACEGWEKCSLAWTVEVGSFSGKPYGRYKDTSVVTTPCGKYKFKMRFWPNGIDRQHKDYAAIGVLFITGEPLFFNSSIVITDSNNHFMKASWCPSKQDRDYIDAMVIRRDNLFSGAYDDFIKMEIDIFYSDKNIHYSESNFEESLKTPFQWSSDNSLNNNFNSAMQKKSHKNIPLQHFDNSKKPNETKIRSKNNVTDAMDELCISDMPESASVADKRNYGPTTDKKEENKTGKSQEFKPVKQYDLQDILSNIKRDESKEQVKTSEVHLHRFSSFDEKCSEPSSTERLQKLLDRNRMGHLEISSLSEPVTHILLEFLEVGAVQILNFDVAMELLNISKKYKLQGLKDICESFIASNLKTNNVCSVLRDDSNQELKSLANDFAVNNFEKFSEPEIKDLAFTVQYQALGNILVGVAARMAAGHIVH